jgi:hypothetical protein
MRLVAVTRILNEDDIVEAFVRHHAAIVDHHLFLDNGSVDRTLEILAGLSREGMRVSVMQNRAVSFTESFANTNLLRIGVSLGADWIVFLDADEFIDQRHFPGGLRARLDSLAPEIDCLRLPVIDYVDVPGANPSDLLIPRRMLHRDRVAPAFIPSVTLRASLAARGARVVSGNHGAFIDETEVASFDDHLLRLAHYPRRNPWQAIAKTTMGRLKVLASGRTVREQPHSFHYVADYETIRDRPHEMLRNPAFLTPTYANRDLIADPIAYLGGPLAYTLPGDPMMKAVRAMTSYAEMLAEEHARLIDTNEGVRLQSEQHAGIWTSLF